MQRFFTIAITTSTLVLQAHASSLFIRQSFQSCADQGAACCPDGVTYCESAPYCYTQPDGTFGCCETENGCNGQLHDTNTNIDFSAGTASANPGTTSSFATPQPTKASTTTLLASSTLTSASTPSATSGFLSCAEQGVSGPSCCPDDSTICEHSSHPYCFLGTDGEYGCCATEHGCDGSPGAVITGITDVSTTGGVTATAPAPSATSAFLSCVEQGVSGVSCCPNGHTVCRDPSYPYCFLGTDGEYGCCRTAHGCDGQPGAEETSLVDNIQSTTSNSATASTSIETRSTFVAGNGSPAEVTTPTSPATGFAVSTTSTSSTARTSSSSRTSSAATSTTSTPSGVEASTGDSSRCMVNGFLCMAGGILIIRLLM